MYFAAESLDDLLRSVFPKLLKSRNTIQPTKGPATELVGTLLTLKNPRMRLSRTETKGTLFSCLGEFLWYLSGSNSLEFIKYYISMYEKFSDDGKTIHGGYGPRLFGENEDAQFANVFNLLKGKQDSRQAVIQLFRSADICGSPPHKDIPCTCSLQFMIRGRKLHLITYMRSNDAYRGLPHDVFAFTMFQEIMARRLDIEVGSYKHAVGSLHLYDENRESAQQYLDEDWQSRVPMPAMPIGDPCPSLQTLIQAEECIRQGKKLNTRQLDLAPYWMDFIHVLQIYRATTSNKTNKNAVGRLTKKIMSPVYAPYIRKRVERKLGPMTPKQLDFFPR